MPAVALADGLPQSRKSPLNPDWVFELKGEESGAALDQDGTVNCERLRTRDKDSYPNSVSDEPVRASELMMAGEIGVLDEHGRSDSTAAISLTCPVSLPRSR